MNHRERKRAVIVTVTANIMLRRAVAPLAEQSLGLEEHEAESPKPWLPGPKHPTM